MSDAHSRAAALRQLYGAFAAGDLEVVEAQLDPAVEFVNPDDAVDSGTRYGPDAFIRALRGLREMFDYRDAEIVELVEDDGETIAVVRFHVRGRESDVELDLTFAHRLRWRGDRIVRLEWFRDREAALAGGG